jgi:hypothetical protein
MQADVTAGRLAPIETWAGFREALRELHAECGAPKYGTLSATSGLAKSAISGLIGANPVQRPSEGTTLRFVEACLTHAHRDPDRVATSLTAWRATWHRLRAKDEVHEEVQEEVPDSPSSAVATPAPSRSGRRRLGLLASAAGIAAAAVAASLWLAHPSGAQPPASHPRLAAGTPTAGCTRAASDQPDVRTHRHWHGVFVCPTKRTPVYQWASLAGAPIGLLRSNPSWIVCWTRGQDVDGSDVWYYTQGDDLLGKDALDAWGFISARTVRVPHAPDPGITRRCPFATAPAHASKN